MAIKRIHNNIIKQLNKIGTDVRLKLRGTEVALKSTLVDPSAIRNFPNLPDWKNEIDLSIYISYKVFIDKGYLHADINDIESVYYQGVWYKVLHSMPFGFLENQAAYIFLGLSK